MTCKGLNCKSADGTNHSVECEAQHAAACAGGEFAKHRSKAWAVYTNTDLTEGRGAERLIGLCELKPTAQRFGAHRYVMGSDCPLAEVDIYTINGRIYGPVTFVPATDEDVREQALLTAKDVAIRAMKSKGVTDAEIEALTRGTS